MIKKKPDKQFTCGGEMEIVRYGLPKSGDVFICHSYGKTLSQIQERYYNFSTASCDRPDDELNKRWIVRPRKY